jgi:thiopurine S-methyltransferase
LSNHLWKEKWRRKDTAFHQKSVNPLLQQFLPRMALVAGEQVLVPMCGKSLDMNWIGNMGFSVLGIELSRIAIEAFFDARRLTPSRQKFRNFIRWQHGTCEIWCGDVFDLRVEDLGQIKLLYDCAALTALPMATRQAYVQHFAKVLPQESSILLMTTETPDIQIDNSVSVIPHTVIVW